MTARSTDDLIPAHEAAREYRIPPHVLADLWAKDRIGTWWIGNELFVSRDEMVALALAGWMTGGSE